MRSLAIAASFAIALAACSDGSTTGSSLADAASDTSGGPDTGADAGATDASGDPMDRPDATDDVSGDATEDAGEPDTPGADTGMDADPDANPDADAGPTDTGFDAADVFIPDIGEDIGGFDIGDDVDATIDDGMPVEIHVRDIWGRLLPADGFEATLTRDDGRSFVSTAPRTRLSFDEGDRWTIEVDPDHGFAPMATTVSVTDEGIEATAPGNTRAAVTLQVTDGDPDYIVHLGVPHRWFASHAAPARFGNEVQLLFNGEEAWRHAQARIRAADDWVHIAIWWWESDFEMVRDEPFAPRAVRQENTLLSALESNDATTRVIVWDNIAIGFLNTDDALETRGETPGDDFEYMPQDNPTRDAFDWSFERIDFGARVAGVVGAPARDFDATVPNVPLGDRIVDPTDWPLGIELAAPIASWHQKLIIIDGDEAYVSGMNLKANDWDRTTHAVYDPRRMAFDASEADRRDVQARGDRPDFPPRRDYIAYVRGPAARDVADVFAMRWDDLLDAGAENADVSTPAGTAPTPRAVDDGVLAQFVTTMPDPYFDYGLLESHLNAIRAAESYIFIEDQYWRAPVLLDALIARMTARPGLQLVVVTQPVSEWTDPGCEWTHRMHEALADRFEGRYHLMQLRSFATRDDGFIGDEINVEWADINIHSKLMIVDDVFLSVGSGNKNNRGYLYEGEANLNVWDPVVVRAWRERLVANLLGVDDAPSRWIEALVDRAEANGRVWQRWDDEGNDLDLDGDPLPPGFTPTGFVHPLTFRTPDDCFIEGVGPDVTGEPSTP